VKVTIVGCAPAFTLRPGRASSCYLVEEDGAALVLDLGQGAFSALAGYRDPQSVRAVVISHLHADHGVDLVALRHYLRYGTDRTATVELHAPPELRERYDRLLGEPGFLDDLPGDALVPGTRTIGPFVVEVARVTHAQSSFAFRVTRAGGDDRPGLVYSGDCARWEDLLGLVRPGDTLLCEAYFGDGEAVPEAGHLDAGLAGRAAGEGRAARLVLTHIRDGNDPGDTARRAAEAFGGSILIAEPGLRLDLA
jgi:ribonuclease BN (tRNA processing enzyme)